MMNHGRVSLALLAWATLPLARELPAEEASRPPASQAARLDPDTRPTPGTSEQFSSGTWTLQLDGTFIRPYENRHFEQFAGGQVGIGYYLIDRLSVNADLPVYWVNQRGPKTVGSGFDLLARWNFVERGRLSLYVDGGAGLLVADHSVPRGGTHVNFMPQIGLGMTWMLDRHAYLFGGARLWHLSNAGFEGQDRNPSVDGSVMGYIGIGWRF